MSQMSQTLYELTAAYQDVWRLVDDDDADLDALEDTLQAIEAAINVKARNIAIIIRQLSAQAAALDAEIKRLQARKQTAENRAKWLKNYLQTQMELAGNDKVKTDLYTIAIQKNPPAVVIRDDTAIPAEYRIVIPEQHVPDKKRIAAALMAGQSVPGAELVQGRSLRIR